MGLHVSLRQPARIGVDLASRTDITRTVAMRVTSTASAIRLRYDLYIKVEKPSGFKVESIGRHFA